MEKYLIINMILFGCIVLTNLLQLVVISRNNEYPGTKYREPKD